MSDCQADTIIRPSKIPCCFGHKIGHEVFLEIRLEPARVEHIRRAHHAAAAPIEPFALSLGSRIRLRRHLSNLPAELNAASVTALQFRPGRLGPMAPGRNAFGIGSDSSLWTY